MRGAVAALSMAACLAPAAANAQEAVSDPWEGLNRDLYAVHDAVDQAVLEPVARGYRAVTNEPIRRGVRNVLRNLRAPVIFANDLLQGEPRRAGATAARFGLNTTIGVLGVFDPASSLGIEYHSEDFGQTLAIWGLDAGPYLFVPVLGPTTVRDGVGRLVDIAIDPFTWAEFDGEGVARTTRTVTDGVATREELIEVIEDTRETSVDPYVSYRTSYGLLRDSEIRNGPIDVQELPDFEASFEDAPPVEEFPQQSAPITPETPVAPLEAEG